MISVLLEVVRHCKGWTFGVLALNKGCSLYIYIYISILVLVIFSAFDTLLLEGGILLNYMLVILVGLNISIWLCLSVFDISEGILGFI